MENIIIIQFKPMILYAVREFSNNYLLLLSTTRCKNKQIKSCGTQIKNETTETYILLLEKFKKQSTFDMHNKQK